MSVAKRDLDDTRKVTTHRLMEMKQRGEKISMLTAYDYSMAKLIDQAGMDVILVGDSASNVMAGNVTYWLNVPDGIPSGSTVSGTAMNGGRDEKDWNFGLYRLYRHADAGNCAQ